VATSDYIRTTDIKISNLMTFLVYGSITVNHAHTANVNYLSRARCIIVYYTITYQFCLPSVLLSETPSCKYRTRQKLHIQRRGALWHLNKSNKKLSYCRHCAMRYISVKICCI